MTWEVVAYCGIVVAGMIAMALITSRGEHNNGDQAKEPEDNE